MKRDTLLGRLEAWAQAETGAQTRLLALLRRQRKSLEASKHKDVETAAIAIDPSSTASRSSGVWPGSAQAMSRMVGGVAVLDDISVNITPRNVRV